MVLGMRLGSQLSVEVLAPMHLPHHRDRKGDGKNRLENPGS